MRVVIDTNIVVSRSLALHGNCAQILDLWQNQTAFDIVVSEEILSEYKRALLYPGVQKRHGMTTAQIDKTIDDFRELAVLVEPTNKIMLIKEDPDDNKFLECAEAGSAQYIVTGDPDLLAVKQYKNIQILTPATFLMLFTK